MCVSSCVGRLVKTGGVEDRTDAGCACEMHGAVTCNCCVECEMSGHGNWWVRLMKTPSLGNSACTKIGSRAEASLAFN